jgi:tetratricopeptide (TPR) repeat protein
VTAGAERSTEAMVKTFDREISDTLKQRGFALAEEGLYTKALESFQQAISFRMDDPVAWYNMGLMLAALERHDDALEAFNQALTKKREYPEAWNQQGAVLSSKKRGSR